MIRNPDHFVLLVNELQDAIKTFRGLGLDTRPGGEHPGMGAHNALIALADGTYLELLAFKDPAVAEKSFWREGLRRLRVREGFAAYILAASELPRDLERLRARGLDYGEPIPGERLRPDGQTVHWRRSFFENTPAGLMPFLIEDVTPHALRIEPPTEGLGARARVAQIVVGVRNVEASREKYRALLDVEPKRVQNSGGDVEGFRFALDWGSIVLAHPTRAGNALADELDQRGEGLYSITLAFANLGDVWSDLNKRGVALEKDGNGYLIPPSAACGARIRLAQQ